MKQIKDYLLVELGAQIEQLKNQVLEANEKLKSRDSEID